MAVSTGYLLYQRLRHLGIVRRRLFRAMETLLVISDHVIDVVAMDGLQVGTRRFVLGDGGRR